MQPLLTADQMMAVDHATIHELGLPGMVLMESAGRACVTELEKELPDLAQRKVLVLCGSGNNGGDGLVIARWLLDRGVDVRIRLFAQGEKLRGDAATNYQILKAMGADIREVVADSDLKRVDSWIGHVSVVVDALFGTGLSRPLEGRFAAVVEAINRHDKKVLAVDIPSGVSADSGEILGCAVQAHWTVTFAAAKIGHYSHPGAELCGALTVAQIGIPQMLLQQEIHRVYLNEPTQWQGVARRAASHKGSHGHLLVVAGSRGKSGAAALTLMGAQRMGPGLMTAALPQSIQPEVAVQCSEAMTLPLVEDEQGAIAEGLNLSLETAALNPDALAVGPGLGRAEQGGELLQDLLALDIPTVVDADGLNILADNMALLKRPRKAPLILTPHPGEMARLLGLPTAEVQKSRLDIARDFAQQYELWLLLKGAGSVIASPDGRAWLNPTGNHGLATGGSGDLLTGMVGSLLAQGWQAGDALRAAVWMHGRAADFCAAEQGGPIGLRARDLLPQLQLLRNRLDEVV
uniref:Bifunctional NAD(P)H-hydrate repair enzyme n=1 Tax=Magnetococcus massalia (strain MO-1) TaxID=451514 RepID=A0A1S7LJS4_MAGMO|nr:conserved protein of unknown function [similar to predicted Carbohydrate kinase YjeF from Escherichia coli] [Candidatus Magnetococcus massalia]